LFYNQETKQYKIVCPHQKVSAAGAEYNKGMTVTGWDMIGTIHSHASMSAFHSGIDDKDEESFDGLHITFGNMRDDDISISASIVANGFRVIVDPRDYINQLEMTVDIDEDEKIPYAKTWKWDAGKKKMMEVTTAGKYYTRRKFDQRYQVRLSKDPKFDESWMDRVEKQTYSYTTAYTTGKNWKTGWQGHNAGYGDSSYWKNWAGHQNTQGVKPKTIAPATVARANFDGLNSPPKDDKITPCTKCTFNHHKFIPNLDDLPDEAKETVIEWALDQLNTDANYTISSSLDEDEDDLSHYECVSCRSKFTVDESDSLAEAFCPICKTDDYLVEITAAEVLLDECVTDDNPSDEEVEVSGIGMVKCKECGSSFTKEFVSDGTCPFCQTILVPEDHPSNNQMLADTGHYMEPDQDAIDTAIAADEDAERLPIPGQTSIPISKQPSMPGVLARLFNRRKNKK